MAAPLSFSSPSSSSSSCFLHLPPSLSPQRSVAKLTLRCPSFSLRSSIKSRGLRVFSPRAASVAFRNLDADDFRHPLDRRNTLLLKAIPGLNDLVKTLIGSITEQVMLLENIGPRFLFLKIRNWRPYCSKYGRTVTPLAASCRINL